MLLEFFKSSALFILCLILSRFIGLPSNFTPIIAVASFLPFLTSNRYIQLFLPVGILIITDPFLGFYSSIPVVYFCIFIASLFSVLSKSFSYKNLIFRGFGEALKKFRRSFGDPSFLEIQITNFLSKNTPKKLSSRL